MIPLSINEVNMLRCLKAIKARLNGVWDDPDLMSFGELTYNPKDDIADFVDQTLDILDDPESQKLANIYGWWGQHPKYPRADWGSECFDNNTTLGYWEWVVGRIDDEDEDYPDSVEVEYDLDYSGGNYEDVGSFVFLTQKQLKARNGNVIRTFQEVTGIDPVHIINYHQSKEEEVA